MQNEKEKRERERERDRHRESKNKNTASQNNPHGDIKHVVLLPELHPQKTDKKKVQRF